MMKKTMFYFCILVLSASGAIAADNLDAGHSKQETLASGEGAVTVSMRESDASLCNSAFWTSLYDLTVVAFSHGAAQVEVSEYEQEVFAWARASEESESGYGNAEAFVEHIKDIPRQLVEIIREDPAVLDSCSNFSIALIGP